MRFVRSILPVAVGVLACIPAVSRADAANAAIHPFRPTSSTQLLMVNASRMSTSTATLTAYQWDGTKWSQAFAPMDASLGANGLTDNPSESDYFTPTGQYDITTVFGSEPDPGTLFPYRRTTSNDHWVDDPTSAVYNTWQTGPANGRWNSAETLSSYHLAAAFDFNQQPVVPGGDSAIFLHSGTSATLGCVTLNSPNLQTILTWIDPTKKPQIIIGVNLALPEHLEPTPAPVPWAELTHGQQRQANPFRQSAIRLT